MFDASTSTIKAPTCFLRLIVVFALLLTMCFPTMALADVSDDLQAGSLTEGDEKLQEPAEGETFDEEDSSAEEDGQDDSLDVEPDPTEEASLAEDSEEIDESDSSEPIYSSEDSASLGVSATAHVQTYGWLSSESGSLGETMSLGTTAQSKRIEAFTLAICDNTTEFEGGIRYRVHVQTYGWQEWTYDGGVAGTTGQSKRIEAVQIELTGELAEQYDLYYRAHAQNYGWLGWAKDGSIAGTCGFSKRLEAVQIVLVAKGSEPPGATAVPYLDESILEAQKVSNARISYRTHVQKYGWQGLVYDGETSGTSGESKRLEGIEVSFGAGLANLDGGVTYRTHVQNYGWQDWVSNGAMAGTSGESKRLEAIEIKLTGTASDVYDIYYRVHAQRFGWMGWAKNGESAGTAGYSYRLEAIQIVLIEKGGEAPGSTSFAFAQKANPTGTAQEFVAVALAEPDGRPAGGDRNKYTNYRYDAWCAYFVTWCARQAGVPTAAIPNIYLCSSLKGYYQTRGLWHSYAYVPRAGDIIFYSTYSGGTPCHVGIVTGCSGGKIYTKEGNVGSGVVDSRTRIAGSSYVSGGWYIVGYASPTFNREG